jgi:phosphoribosyl-dephospho-CoA transferase
MAGVSHDSFRVHDLLLLRRGLLSAAGVAQPAWLASRYPANQWVVVRRSVAPEGLVAVGVRGSTRQQRWGGYADSADIIERLRPSQLSSHRMRRARLKVPALATLSWLEGKISHSELDWGPVGSVGFELASGQQVVTATSDLDIAIFAPARFTREAARDLWKVMKDAPAKIDVRVETPLCGFSLEEYAREGTETVLIRLSDQRQFATDPWSISVIKDEA